MCLLKVVCGIPSSADSFPADFFGVNFLALSSSRLSASSWFILYTPSLEKFAFPSQDILLWRFLS